MTPTTLLENAIRALAYSAAIIPIDFALALLALAIARLVYEIATKGDDK